MNNISITARLTQDPIIRSTKDELKYAWFGIADKQYGKEEPLFLNCKVFGKTAEYVDKYISKGDLVSISGKLVTDFRDKKMTVLEINNIQLCAKAKIVKEEKSEPKDPSDLLYKKGDDEIPF